MNSANLTNKIDGSWNVAFLADRGAPASAVFEKLASYTESGDTGIKYYSGTATYIKTVNIPVAPITKGSRIMLDLGDVKNLAEIVVNSISLGVIWKQPFKVELTDALNPGENKLEIKVVNL